MRTVRILVLAISVVGFVLPLKAQTSPPAWADYEKVTYEQQGESLYVAITFKGLVSSKGLLHAGNTFFNDYDDNKSTGQQGNVGSETNLTFCDWDADSIWCMRTYGLWSNKIGNFVFRAQSPVSVSVDGKTLSFRHSLVGLGLEDVSYDVNGYYLQGSNWWNDPWNQGGALDSVQLYSFNPSLVPALDTSLVGTRSQLKIPTTYRARAVSENIVGALDDIVRVVESEIGTISPAKRYTVTYNPFSDNPVFIYVSAPNNTFTTYIPGTQWVDTPNWWAMLEGAVYQTMAERSAGYREIFMTTMSTDIPLPNTPDSWYSTRYDSTHGMLWTTNHKVTFKALLGRAFHNLVTIYVGEKLTHVAARAAAVAARTQASTAYATFSGQAKDLDPWIMTGFLLNKVSSDLSWTKKLWNAFPVTFTLPTDTSSGDSFGQLVKPFLRDGVGDGSQPYSTRKYWYQNIASVQAGAIDAATGKNIYASLKAITEYPTVDSVYNRSKTVFQGLMTSVEETGTGVATGFRLDQNYPNPFNPSTRIAFTIPSHALTTVRVFDMLGRAVAELLNAELAPGGYEVNWNAASLPSGVYYYRVQSGNHTAVGKAVLLK